MLIKTEVSDKIIGFLRQRFLVNENIIGVLENMPNAEIFVDNVDNPKGVLVKKDDYMHYVYTEEAQFIDDMCENYLKEGFYGFSGVEGELAEKIRKRFMLGWESRCNLYYMPKENLDLSLIKNPTERIRIEDAETVDRFYQFRDNWTLETIKRDISNRPSSAVYIDNEPVCWVLIHDDNSMGIMYTKEEHRRKGYAVDVTIDLARQIVESGRIPFIQIIESNGMSPGLAEKCGFVKIGKADWFGIIAGNPKELAEANESCRQQFLKTMPQAIHEKIFIPGEVYFGLYYLLYNFVYKPSDIEGLSLVKAETKEQKATWLRLTGKHTGKFIKEFPLEDPTLNLYLLQKNDEAIGASLTQRCQDEDTGLYLLSMLPEYDNAQMLKILAAETLNYEKNNGCHFLVVQSSQHNLVIFEELGFRKSHTIL